MTARVLVVDDVAANVKLLEARLSAEYFDVITAMSGEQALAICARAECDLVLLDLMMPDLDTERLRDNVQISIEMAITDALTGLFNRRYMESHLAGLLEQASARGKPLAVLVIDIDYFKSINDTHGHDAGDDVLREFALRIKRSIRGIDLACRYGGEEFVVVMPETDMAVAAMVAERLRRRIAAEPFAIHEGARSIPVTISIGIAALRGADDNAAGVLKRADQALYRAKRDGRNRVVPDAA